jgi:hypothetical protein
MYLPAENCDFLGHSATMGYNKCKKEFPGMIGEKNYGGLIALLLSTEQINHIEIKFPRF